MAAGSYEVSSTRFVHGSEKENSLYKNGSCRGYHLSKLSSSGDFNGHARGLFLDRDDEREHVDLLVEGKRSFGARWPRKDEEIAGFGDGTQMPPEKKRKYSPIVWDRYGEGVRISSKNRVVVTAHNTASKAPSDVSADQIRGLHIDLADSSLNDVFHGGSFDPLEDLSTSLPKDCQRNEEEADETDDHMNLRKISTSKWLNDFNCSDDEDISISDASIGFVSRRTRSNTDISSLDCSEGSRKRSSGSESDKSGQFKGLDCGDRYYENELEIDDNHDDDSFCIENIGGRKHRSVNMLQGSRSVFEYEKLNEINEGTYGVVFRGKDKATGEVVALKKVKMGREEDGFPISSLREINILASLHHPSIVDVKEVVTDDRDGVFMVMEYMEHDLKGLMDVMKQPYSQSEVKCLMLQLLEGIKYLHDNWIIHRDLKTSNLLLNNRGELKICDFGMSRQYGSPLKPYTPLVVTLWYRAPELLLGAKKYSTAIDMWSVGCIMAELLSKEPLFKGEREIEQIRKIYETLGTPNESIWPGLSKLPGGKVTHVKQTYNTLRKKFPAATFIGSPVLTELGFDLLNRLLTYDPEKRITAEDALNHGWFREVPLPKSKEFMPTFPPAQQRRSTSRKPKTRGW